MSADHFLFFGFLFICYSFGIFSIGYVAGQQSVTEKAKRPKKWPKEIERN